MDAKPPADTTPRGVPSSASANRTAINTGKERAQLRADSGECYPVKGAGHFRIGRRSDNDIVLNDPRVSRHHAVIIDTGTSFVLIDARSANGVEMDHNRIRGSAPLSTMPRTHRR